MADERFGSCPDLLVVDGGKPQLTAALTQLEQLGTRHLRCAALPRRTRRCSCPGTRRRWCCPTARRRSTSSSRCATRRTASPSPSNRELRDKAMTVSVLDEVEGVGPTRKKAIMPPLRLHEAAARGERGRYRRSEGRAPAGGGGGVRDAPGVEPSVTAAWRARRAPFVPCDGA